ncbi:MAG: ATP:cob(I)alamin adenosyltransferase [Flavobacteriales bacterium]|nr:ATP:cob(I)alamin adenosyltransferase [Flavobacteriales bacterium]|tara:strand:- start:2260 stop:2793 length:534 start_codon:yes stop_codon:yes gene_type:complete
MKIYTKKGDLGKTSIIGSNNIDKHSIRIEAYGTIDELNSHIGLLSSCPYEEFEKYSKELVSIQNCLFRIGASLASKNNIYQIEPTEIDKLESSIDAIELILNPLKSFILPGGDMWSSYSQISRSVCRRAERRITHLNTFEKIDVNIIKYINRLSDYLFVIARLINHINKIDEIKWKG